MKQQKAVNASGVKHSPPQSMARLVKRRERTPSPWRGSFWPRREAAAAARLALGLGVNPRPWLVNFRGGGISAGFRTGSPWMPMTVRGCVPLCMYLDNENAFTAFFFDVSAAFESIGTDILTFSLSFTRLTPQSGDGSRLFRRVRHATK